MLQVVPKKHNRCVTVNFMPFPTWDVNGDISCHSLGLGYISLPDTVSHIYRCSYLIHYLTDFH